MKLTISFHFRFNAYKVVISFQLINISLVNMHFYWVKKNFILLNSYYKNISKSIYFFNIDDDAWVQIFWQQFNYHLHIQLTNQATKQVELLMINWAGKILQVLSRLFNENRGVQFSILVTNIMTHLCFAENISIDDKIMIWMRVSSSIYLECTRFVVRRRPK